MSKNPTVTLTELRASLATLAKERDAAQKAASEKDTEYLKGLLAALAEAIPRGKRVTLKEPVRVGLMGFAGWVSVKVVEWDTDLSGPHFRVRTEGQGPKDSTCFYNIVFKRAELVDAVLAQVAAERKEPAPKQ